MFPWESNQCPVGGNKHYILVYVDSRVQLGYRDPDSCDTQASILRLGLLWNVATPWALVIAYKLTYLLF